MERECHFVLSVCVQLLIALYTAKSAMDIVNSSLDTVAVCVS